MIIITIIIIIIIINNHNKNNETGCIGKFSEKKRKDVLRTIATAKMKLSVALVIRFQPLTNIAKNPNIGTMGVLNAPLEYYKIF